MAKKKPLQKSKQPAFVTVFRHYRTGKRMYAKKYGHKAWPIWQGRRAA